MQKARVNFIIDAAMLACGAALAGIGFLMKFVLIPGKERFAVYGRNVDLFFLGIGRHEWGTLHLWLAVCLAGLLAGHIFLHLGWITGMARNMIAGRMAGTIMAAAFLVLCLVLALFAFAVTPDVREGGGEGEGGQGHGFGRGRMHRLP